MAESIAVSSLRRWWSSFSPSLRCATSSVAKFADEFLVDEVGESSNVVNSPFSSKEDEACSDSSRPAAAWGPSTATEGMEARLFEEEEEEAKAEAEAASNAVVKFFEEEEEEEEPNIENNTRYMECEKLIKKKKKINFRKWWKIKLNSKRRVTSRTGDGDPTSAVVELWEV